MKDLIKRLLMAGVVGVCISLLFLGGNQPKAEGLTKGTEHWIWPTDGEITDTYGTRNGMHKGIDIASALNTPVYSVDEGVVSKSYYSDTYGHVVFIKHQNNFETVYAHLHKRNVEEGEWVQQGTLIGKMGNTGDSSGVHLHFEVHHDEWTYNKKNAVNPDHTLGLTEVGQAVLALSTANPGESIETSVQLEGERERGNSDNGQTQKRNHIVKPGETLWSISQKYGISVDELTEINQLSDPIVKVGQALMIVDSVSKNQRHYVVSKGDTLSSISRNTGIPVSDIKDKNNLKSNTIHPEQVLIIQ